MSTEKTEAPLNYAGWKLGIGLQWRLPKDGESVSVLQQAWEAIGEQPVPFIWLDVLSEKDSLEDLSLRIDVGVKEELARRQKRDRDLAEMKPSEYFC